MPTTDDDAWGRLDHDLTQSLASPRPGRSTHRSPDTAGDVKEPGEGSERGV
jgi:hypothetical protein